MAETSRRSTRDETAEPAPAPSDKLAESFPLARWKESPAAVPTESHILAGAAVLAGWDDNTILSKSEVRDGVKAFLAHKPEEAK